MDTCRQRGTDRRGVARWRFAFFMMVTLLLHDTAFAASENGLEAPPRRLTLEAALRHARSGNLDLQIAQERLKRSAYISRKAWSFLLPKLSGQADLVRNNQRIAFGDTVIQELYQTRANVDLSWTLLNARSLPLIQMAYAEVEEAEWAFAEREELLRFSTLLGFYRVVHAQKNHAIQLRAVEQADARLQAARARHDVGETTRLDTLRAEADLAARQEGVVMAREALRLHKHALALLLGWVDDTGQVTAFEAVEPADIAASSRLDAPSTPAGEWVWPPLGTLLKTAREERLDLQQRRLEVRLAEKDEAQTWLQLLPEVVGTGNYSWSDARGFAGQQGTWRLGLSLRWTFFNGLETLYGSREKAHDRRAVELNLRQAHRQVAVEVRNAQVRLESALEKRRVAEVRYRAAEAAAGLADAQYRGGSATYIDVSEAHHGRDDAASAVALAELDVATAVATLDHVLRAPEIASDAGFGR